VLTNLSATQPQIGLKIPYRLENSRNINPICSVVRLNCRKWGSSVGSRNAHVLDTITITSPVIIIEGILNSLNIEADFEPTAYSEIKR
jgi:hypothetical protein